MNEIVNQAGRLDNVGIDEIDFFGWTLPFRIGQHDSFGNSPPNLSDSLRANISWTVLVPLINEQ